MRSNFYRTGSWVLGGLVLLVALKESRAEQPGRTDSPVAIVLGRKISRADLAPDPKTREAKRKALTPEDYVRWEEAQEVQRLQEQVLGPLLADYVRRKGLEPTKEELEAFNAMIHSGVERELAKSRKELELKRAELKRVDLAPERRKALQAEVESQEEEVRTVTEQLATSPSLPQETDIARGMIIPWKLQRALHREYGGDIIFQQMGPEAVGAYPPLLEERQKAGDFQLLDEELAQRFWERVRHPRGSRIKDPNVLETPWWLEKP